MPYLTDLATFLDDFLRVECFAGDQNGIYRESDRAVRKLALTLEPFPGLESWVEAHSPDALWLHRPWKLSVTPALTGVGVLAYHLAFDERLTIGYNPLLADALRMTNIVSFGEKEGRPLGMVGEVEPVPWERFRERVSQVFGREEAVLAQTNPVVKRVAAVGAMTDALVNQAADQGANVYLTGALRKSVQPTALSRQLPVFAVGHRRSEEWGLRTLATVLRQQWPDLEITVLASG